MAEHDCRTSWTDRPCPACGTCLVCFPHDPGPRVFGRVAVPAACKDARSLRRLADLDWIEERIAGSGDARLLSKLEATRRKVLRGYGL